MGGRIGRSEQYQSYADTWSTGIEESAGRSRVEGARPRATISAPSAATIAPLSVHSPGRGTRTLIPPAAHAPRPSRAAASWRRRHRRSGGPRRRARCSGVDRLAGEHVARPPPGTTRRRRRPAPARPVASRACTHRATAVLSPENEKSKRCRSMSRRGGQPAREVDRHRVAPRRRRPVDVRAARERQPEQPRRPCRTPRPPRRRSSSPAARSSAVTSADQQQRGVAAGDEQRQARLRQRRRARAGRRRRGRRGGSRRRAACRAPSASALAAATPTSSAPARPGPGGHRDRVDVGQRHPGRRAGALDGRHHRLEVGARRDLGHDAAEPRVLLDRGGDRVGEQGVAAHDARRRSRRTRSRCRGPGVRTGRRSRASLCQGPSTRSVRIRQPPAGVLIH